MPYCQNCDHHVSAQYVRVRGIDGEVDSCPWCPDRVPDASSSKGYRETAQQTDPTPAGAKT